MVGELLELGGAGVVIVGVAGVGKTRLAAEVARIAQQRGYVVEWVRATRSAAQFPLGAFASLLPPGLGEEAELLARARRALGRHAEGRRLALCIDDAHLLDDASAALVHQLGIAGEAFVAVILRRDGDASDALRSLWKDELCPLIELEALARADVVSLLGRALGGPVDGPTANALWELTHGNALFLRELVLYGLERGALEHTDGIWRWRGTPAVGARLGELVEARLEGLAGRDALEVVALGAPLEVDLLQRSEEHSLDALERSGLVVRRLDGRRRRVDVAHPMHGEAVRAHLSVTRSEAIQRRLADAVESLGARRREDVPRLAAWRLAAGGGASELFVGAAEHALSALDFASAERFARAAGDAFRARLALGCALAGAGRAHEAESVLATLTARTDDELSPLAIARARNLFWALDRPADAGAVLEHARVTVSGRPARDELLAHHVRLAAAAGRPDEALAAAMPLLGDDTAHEPARVVAVTAAAEALLSSGRTDEAIALTEQWEPIAARQPESTPLLELLIRSERAFALRFAGRLVDATELAEHNYGRAVQRRSAATTAVEAVFLGFVWLARGQVARGLRFCREGVALLRDADPAGMLPWALAGVAQAAAHAGLAEAARDAIVDVERLTLGHTAFAFELGLARAWSAAADGEHTRAQGLAMEASDGAAALGQHASAMRAAHNLCRLGGEAEASPRLAELAGRVDGRFAPLAATHAEALTAGDGHRLLSVADAFADLDALLLAAEAASAGALALRDEGRADSARAASARSAAWLGRCEGARPPTLVAPDAAAELTAREREIAALAARGLTSREIADRLVVSVRTVDNHLQRVYRKLGVTGRGELSRLLAVE
jgi:DNA-binding CsgD family transcriptional regulator